MVDAGELLKSVPFHETDRIAKREGRFLDTHSALAADYAQARAAQLFSGLKDERPRRGSSTARPGAEIERRDFRERKSTRAAPLRMTHWDRRLSSEAIGLA